MKVTAWSPTYSKMMSLCNCLSCGRKERKRNFNSFTGTIVPFFFHPPIDEIHYARNFLASRRLFTLPTLCSNFSVDKGGLMDHVSGPRGTIIYGRLESPTCETPDRVIFVLYSEEQKLSFLALLAFLYQNENQRLI
jgi:hypothetical protein